MYLYVDTNIYIYRQMHMIFLRAYDLGGRWSLLRALLDAPRVAFWQKVSLAD